MTEFEQVVIDAVTGHMNGDHPEDNLLIVRAFGAPAATQSTMTGLDAKGGIWLIVDTEGEREVHVAWPGGEISERPEVRREVVALYKAACAKFGVEPREEHQPEAESGAAHGGHGAGHGGHGSPHGGGHSGGHGRPNRRPEEDGTFATHIRVSTWKDHGESEGSKIMADMMARKATKDDYTDLVVQHFYMYDALDPAVALFADNPLYAGFHPASLGRQEAISADLEYLIGADWKQNVTAVPAVQAYATRINELAAEQNLLGILAHHYTRYMGDLSGGQMIAKLMRDQHGFETRGVQFYDFAEIGPLGKFKGEYRDGLNTLGETLSDAEKQLFVDEVHRAYKFNSDTFLDMDKVRNAASAS